MITKKVYGSKKVDGRCMRADDENVLWGRMEGTRYVVEKCPVLYEWQENKRRSTTLNVPTKTTPASSMRKAVAAAAAHARIPG